MTRIVTMKDTRPLVVRAEDVEKEPVWICRCGLSADWPYCDDSHKKARAEEQGKTYRYRRVAPDAPLEQAEGLPGVPHEADPRPE